MFFQDQRFRNIYILLLCKGGPYYHLRLVYKNLKTINFIIVENNDMSDINSKYIYLYNYTSCEARLRLASCYLGGEFHEPGWGIKICGPPSILVGWLLSFIRISPAVFIYQLRMEFQFFEPPPPILVGKFLYF